MLDTRPPIHRPIAKWCECFTMQAFTSERTLSETAESVDIRTALRSYTIWAAHQLFLEKSIGSIEPGKDADFAVWDRDMYTIPTSEIKDLKREMTILKGRIVYRAVETPVSQQ